MGPYSFKDQQWVGYDDVAMIRRKSEFVKEKNYGGAMIWALDLDDFNNVCGCEEYPLLRTINRVLRNYARPDPKCDARTYQVQPYGLSAQATWSHVQQPAANVYLASNPVNYVQYPYFSLYPSTYYQGQPQTYFGKK